MSDDVATDIDHPRPASIGAVGLVAPPEARASVDITEVRVESVTATSFGVRVNSLGSGWSYRLYASTDKADVYVANLGEGPYRSSLARVPRLSRTGLRYTTKPTWYRVRAAKGTARRTSEIFSLNLSTASAFTPSVSAIPTGHGQDIRVMTYNILTLSGDRTRAAGGVISPWSQRRRAAAASINQVKPDLIGLQEGASWTGAVRGPRQVDDLVAVLGGTYGLALTETPPSQPGYFRVGNYVLYKKSTWSRVEEGGRWDFGTMPEGESRYGTYQVLHHRTSGPTMLFVTTHLYTPGGLADARLRQQETESLVRQAGRWRPGRADCRSSTPVTSTPTSCTPSTDRRSP